MMKRFKTKSSVALMLSLAMTASSCVENHRSEDAADFDLLEFDDTTAQAALDDPYGYLGLGNEKSGFSDDEFSEMEGEEVAYDDAYDDESTDDTCDVYFTRVRWGQLRGLNSEIETVADWSGSITANVGTLVLISTIAFDSEDAITDRDDPLKIEFVSKTLPHFDGLRIKYKVCDEDKASLEENEVATVTFDSPGIPLNKSYTVDDLAFANDLVEDLDDLENKFQLQSTLKTDLCQGTLRGRWKNLNNQRGVLRGIVVAENGIKVGMLKGIFGKNKDGENKWIAKFVSRRGRFKGIVKGTYDDGSFDGSVGNRRRGEIGSVQGDYVSAEEGSVGSFGGTYELDCANVPETDE